jgi:hypothetical protein
MMDFPLRRPSNVGLLVTVDRVVVGKFFSPLPSQLEVAKVRGRELVHSMLH